jgi:histidinol dehydrogenase
VRTLPLDSADIPSLCRRPSAPSCEKTVSEILVSVREKGDAALVEFAKKFDKAGRDCTIRVPASEIEAAFAAANPEFVSALEFAASNIREFCEKTKPESRTVSTKYAKITQKAVPLESAGIYAPGGRAPYPSTVLMCAIPAKVAGVNRIALCSPAPVAKQILVAAKICGITEVYAVGGAQAIAAMAYGTKTVRKVDKIVGPGNQYVTEAKKQVRGMGVDIDMLAGPTEVFIVADDLAKADFVAADMLAQLEHGPDSAAIVIATKKKAGEIAKELEGQLAALPRRDIAEASLKNSALLTSDFADLQAIADAVNTYAPEHLELQTTRNAAILELIQNAGAIFIGEQSCEAFGDYCTGSNHVLPTGGSAKFASGLSVDAFVKRIEVVEVTESRELVKNTEILARGEELEGHARSAGKRRGR